MTHLLSTAYDTLELSTVVTILCSGLPNLELASVVTHCKTLDYLRSQPIAPAGFHFVTALSRLIRHKMIYCTVIASWWAPFSERRAKDGTYHPWSICHWPKRVPDSAMNADLRKYMWAWRAVGSH